MINTAKVSNMLGINIRTDIDFLSAIENGLPVSSLERVTEIVAPDKPHVFQARIIAPATLKRRRAASKWVEEKLKDFPKATIIWGKPHTSSKKKGMRIWYHAAKGMELREIDDKAWRDRQVVSATVTTTEKHDPAKSYKAMIEQSHLSRLEGQKVIRAADTWALAEEVYGDKDTARMFLERPHPLLQNRAPLEVAIETDVGGQMVKEILLQIQYGTAA